MECKVALPQSSMQSVIIKANRQHTSHMLGVRRFFHAAVYASDVALLQAPERRLNNRQGQQRVQSFCTVRGIDMDL